MNTDFVLGLSAGVFVANTLIGHFIHRMGLLESAGYGMLAASIAALLSLAVLYLR